MKSCHYHSTRLCKNKNHVTEIGTTIRYVNENKCVLCMKERCTKFKNCCPLPSLPNQLETYIKLGNFPDTCVEWWGSYYSNNYGHFRKADKDYLTHKYAMEVFLSKKIPKGLVVCHSCDNRRCLNPRHLFVGTQGDNMQDYVDKFGPIRRTYYSGDANPNTKIKDAQVAEIREKYKTRKYTIPMLAREYGVSTSLIAKVVQNRVRVS